MNLLYIIYMGPWDEPSPRVLLFIDLSDVRHRVGGAFSPLVTRSLAENFHFVVPAFGRLELAYRWVVSEEALAARDRDPRRRGKRETIFNSHYAVTARQSSGAV